jgi:hypothetical protein
MTAKENLDAIDKYLLSIKPTAQVMRHVGSLREQIEAYEVIAEQYAKAAHQIQELLIGNETLSLAVLIASGKKGELRPIREGDNASGVPQIEVIKTPHRLDKSKIP